MKSSDFAICVSLVATLLATWSLLSGGQTTESLKNFKSQFEIETVKQCSISYENPAKCYGAVCAWSYRAMRIGSAEEIAKIVKRVPADSICKIECVDLVRPIGKLAPK